MNPTKRTEILHEALSTGPSGTQHVPFRGRYRELPVIDLPLDLPLYRVENGRIMSQLSARLSEQQVTFDAVQAAQDEPWVQDLLADLLLALARSPEGPIYQELASQKQQTEPLLVSRNGAVVNGNRRLAAMRALYANHPDHYAGFARVRTAVLPEDATAADIEAVESALQLAPETKLAYTWVNRRLKIRRQKDELKLPIGDLLAAYRVEKKAELTREVRELALAEDYLENFCDDPGNYERVLSAETLLVNLQAALGQAPAGEIAVWRRIGFTLIHAVEQEPRALTGYFPFVAPDPVNLPDMALYRLAAVEGMVSDRDHDHDEEEAVLTDHQVQRVQSLMTPQGSVEFARAWTDLLDQIRLETHQKQAPKRLVGVVQQARKIAEKLEAGTLTQQQKNQLGSELAAITYHAQRFLEEQGDAPPPISLARRKWRKLIADPKRFIVDARLVKRRR